MKTELITAVKSEPPRCLLRGATVPFSNPVGRFAHLPDDSPSQALCCAEPYVVTLMSGEVTTNPHLPNPTGRPG